MDSSTHAPPLITVQIDQNETRGDRIYEIEVALHLESPIAAAEQNTKA